MECGDGEKDGVQGPWLLKDQVEQVVQLMDTVIDYILLLFMPILWRNILNLKYANYH